MRFQNLSILLGLNVTLHNGSGGVTSVPVVAGETEVEKWAQNFMFWCLSVIIPLGLLFNVISVPIFMSKSLRRRSASWYLAALAISDSLSLVTHWFEYWLKHERIGIDIVRASPVICIINGHLSYAARLFSALLVTSFTIERFICVVSPLKRAALSKPGRARRVIAFQCVLCIICTSYIPFTIGIVEGKDGREANCDVREERSKIYMVCTFVFLLFGSIVIPILVILTLNIFIMKKVCLRKTSFAHQNSSFGRNGNVARQVRRKSYNTATILLAVSMSFVILNIPYCISFLMLFCSSYGIMSWSHAAMGRAYAAKYITSVPYYVNYCINFLLYNVCARAFRIEMTKLLCYVCQVYESHKSVKRTGTTTSRQTQSIRLTTESGHGRGMCNQFYIVNKCTRPCIRPETYSFASSDPAGYHPGHAYNNEVIERHSGKPFSTSR